MRWTITPPERWRWASTSRNRSGAKGESGVEIDNGSTPHHHSSRLRRELDEQLVQLPECLVHRVRRAATVRVERFLRGIELAHDEQRLAICLRQGDGGDGAVLSAFFVRPDDAIWRCHFEVSA